MLDDLDLNNLQDPVAARRLVERLLNVVEQLSAALATVQAENQRLRDENSQLKGEQAKPRILPSKRAKQDQSSERERRERPKTWCKRAKLPELRIDRVEVCRLDRSTLPDDAMLKDYQEHTVQDLVLQPETILFRRERYAAASTGQTYTAPLPPGYGGEFGPHLQASAVYLYYEANISCPPWPTSSANGPPTLLPHPSLWPPDPRLLVRYYASINSMGGMYTLLAGGVQGDKGVNDRRV